MILAIDTSSALTSVALVDGTDVIAERTHLDARRHAEVLAPLLQEVLGHVDRGSVTAVACGVGPGPYTGLRVGIASARAVGLAWDLPVHGICSLDAIAAAAVSGEGAGDVCVATDARRREVYWARYAADGRRLAGPLVSHPGDISADLRAATWAGHGALAHAADFGHVLASGPPGELGSSSALQYAHAGWIGRRVQALLAAGAVEVATPVRLSVHGGDGSSTSAQLQGVNLLPPMPLYLRRPDAAEPKR